MHLMGGIFVRRSEKVLKLREIFDIEYYDAKCSLDFESPHQLLVAVQLSAQCTDARVNLVTPSLFEKYKNVRYQNRWNETILL